MTIREHFSGSGLNPDDFPYVCSQGKDAVIGRKDVAGVFDRNFVYNTIISYKRSHKTTEGLVSDEKSFSAEGLIHHIIQSGICDKPGKLAALEKYLREKGESPKVRVSAADRTQARLDKELGKARSLVPSQKDKAYRNNALPYNMEFYFSEYPDMGHSLARVMGAALDMLGKSDEEYRNSVDKEISEAGMGDKRREKIHRNAARDAENEAFRMLDIFNESIRNLKSEMERYIKA